MKKVLVAEDEESIREFIVINLKRAGYETVEACDGLQALEQYDACSGDIAVALLDIMMPNMNGYELASSLRESGITIPILMITAKDSFVDMQMGFASGTDGNISDPFGQSPAVYLECAEEIIDCIGKIADRLKGEQH